MGCKRLNAFFGWYRSTSFHSGNDHALGNFGKRVFQIQCTGSSAECADSRAVIIGNSLLIQNIHLFSDCTIDTRITCMKTYCHLAFCLCILYYRDYFFQCHFCAIVDSTDIFAVFQKLWIYQRSCVNDHICFLKILFPSDCNKIRCSRSCSYKMYHNSFLLR